MALCLNCVSGRHSFNPRNPGVCEHTDGIECHCEADLDQPRTPHTPGRLAAADVEAAANADTGRDLYVGDRVVYAGRVLQDRGLTARVIGFAPEGYELSLPGRFTATRVVERQFLHPLA